MLIAEKLERLIGDDSRTHVALTIGVPVYRLSNHLVGRTRPTVAVSIRLARLFAVDPLWLIDDEQEWPPVQLSSAFAKADAADANDVTRARQALHRCVDLLEPARLMRVVVFAGEIIDEQLAEQSAQPNTNGGLGEALGHASWCDTARRSPDCMVSLNGGGAHSDAAMTIVPAAGEHARRRNSEDRLAGTPAAASESDAALSAGVFRTPLAEVAQ